METWPSGRRRSPAKGVDGLSRLEGSNPFVSASTTSWPPTRSSQIEGPSANQPGFGAPGFARRSAFRPARRIAFGATASPAATSRSLLPARDRVRPGRTAVLVVPSAHCASSSHSSSSSVRTTPSSILLRPDRAPGRTRPGLLHAESSPKSTILMSTRGILKFGDEDP